LKTRFVSAVAQGACSPRHFEDWVEDEPPKRLEVVDRVDLQVERGAKDFVAGVEVDGLLIAMVRPLAAVIDITCDRLPATETCASRLRLL
jgi:hypothetical protein